MIPLKFFSRNNTEILILLLNELGRKNSGSIISQKLHISYSDIYKRLTELKTNGFIISEPFDSRTNLWHLTNKGKELAEVYFKAKELVK